MKVIVKTPNMLKFSLTVMNFLEYAVWGAYLTSMGSYLVKIGLAENIGWFYSVQGIVSLFMPAIIGFICSMWIVDLGGMQQTAGLFIFSAALSPLLSVYFLPPTASGQEIITGWVICWTIFAAYALIIAILFATFFKYKHVNA